MDTETENFVRIVLLIFKAGMLICKGVVKRELATVKLDHILQQQKQRLEHKLIKYQYRALFPRNGEPDPEDFDLSLLITVLLDVLNIPKDEREAVEKIKKMRNKIIHCGKALDNVAFIDMKTTVKDALSKLSAGLQADEQEACSKLIDKFLTEPLDEKSANEYIYGIRNEEDFLQDIHEMFELQTWTVVQEIKKSESRIIEKYDQAIALDKEVKRYKGNSASDQEIMLDKIVNTVKEYNVEKESRQATEKERDTIKCEKCFEKDKSSSARVYCYTCGQNLCRECDNQLHIMSLQISMKNHHLQNASYAAENGVDMKDMDICSVHNEQYAYFCKNHEDLCCEKCVQDAHHTCPKVVKVSEIAEHSANFELNPVEEIKRLQGETVSLEKWLESFKEKKVKQLDEIPSILEEKRTRMIDLFDRKAKILTAEAEIIHDEKISKVQKNRAQCKEIIDKTEETKRSMVRIAANGTFTQKFIARQRLNSQIKSFEESFAKIRLIYEKTLSQDYFKDFEEIVEGFATMSINIEHKP